MQREHLFTGMKVSACRLGSGRGCRIPHRGCPPRREDVWESRVFVLQPTFPCALNEQSSRLRYIPMYHKPLKPSIDFIGSLLSRLMKIPIIKTGLLFVTTLYSNEFKYIN